MTHEPYISEQEVAARIGVDYRTVRRWREGGLIPHLRIGRSIRYKWSVVEPYIEKHYRRGPKDWTILDKNVP